MERWLVDSRAVPGDDVEWCVVLLADEKLTA